MSLPGWTCRHPVLLERLIRLASNLPCTTGIVQSTASVLYRALYVYHAVKVDCASTLNSYSTIAQVHLSPLWALYLKWASAIYCHLLPMLLTCPIPYSGSSPHVALSLHMCKSADARNVGMMGLTSGCRFIYLADAEAGSEGCRSGESAVA